MVEDTADESSSSEDVAAGSAPIRGRGRVLRQACSSEPVRPGKAVQPQLDLEESGRLTRATAARKSTKVAEKKKAAAPSPSRRARTPLPPSPPPADVDLEGDMELPFDLGPLSPKRKRKTAAE